MDSRKYLVGVVFISLLIWGPIEHSWPLWPVIRIGYLIIFPLITWYILGWIWRILSPKEETEDRLERALASATGGALLVFAILNALAKTHVDNTEWIQTRDGMEAIGDDIIVQGPNWGATTILVIIAVIAFWYSISKRETN